MHRHDLDDLYIYTYRASKWTNLIRIRTLRMDFQIIYYINIVLVAISVVARDTNVGQLKSGATEFRSAVYPAGGRVSVHGFIIMPLQKAGDVWISHKPMYGETHDFQLTYFGSIVNSTVNPVPLPTNTEVFNSQWTIEPEQWSLNNFQRCLRYVQSSSVQGQL
jgi:hypothetical protein